MRVIIELVAALVLGVGAVWQEVQWWRERRRPDYCPDKWAYRRRR